MMTFFLNKLLVSILFMFSFTEFSHAQDWANLKQFQKGNAELTNPKSGENRIVFMGDSITNNWFGIRSDFFVGKPYINRGISGQTTPQMLLRFRQDVINLKPSAVVILAGTNDVAGNTGPSTIETIAGNIISMAELAEANNIKIVISSVLPVFDFPWNQGLAPAKKIIKLNALIKSYALKHNIVFVDYFTAMADDSNGLKKEFGDDGVHPNAAGYSMMEPLLESALAKALNQSKSN